MRLAQAHMVVQATAHRWELAADSASARQSGRALLVARRPQQVPAAWWTSATAHSTKRPRARDSARLGASGILGLARLPQGRMGPSPATSSTALFTQCDGLMGACNSTGRKMTQYINEIQPHPQLLSPAKPRAVGSHWKNSTLNTPASHAPLCSTRSPNL